jgi:serine phosphatase RsbU (regulator of sigma subunit)
VNGRPVNDGASPRNNARAERFGRNAWRVPLLMSAALLLIAVADVISTNRAVAGASYAIVGLAASAILSVRWTAVIAAAGVGLAAASGLWNETLWSLDWWIRLLLAATLGAFAVALASMRVRRERDLEQMTAVADAAQRAVLRALPAQLGDVGFVARYESASKAAMVGGDLYEVVDSPHGTRVVVGDVRGKGLEAVHLSATVMAAFRWAAVTEPSLENVAADLDTVVKAVAGDEDFVTAVLAEFHPDRVSLVNCGHPAPLLVEGHQARLVDTGEPALPLGLGTEPHSVDISWPRGARLLMYTDGLAESRNRHGEFFPLLDAAEPLDQGPLDDALDRLLAVAHTHAAQWNDDVAIVLAEHHARTSDRS